MGDKKGLFDLKARKILPTLVDKKSDLIQRPYKVKTKSPDRISNWKTMNIPITLFGRKSKLNFNPQSLPDLKR